MWFGNNLQERRYNRIFLVCLSALLHFSSTAIFRVVIYYSEDCQECGRTGCGLWRLFPGMTLLEMSTAMTDENNALMK